MTTGLPVAFTAITQNAVGGIGTAGGSLRLFAQNITGVNKKTSRTDNLNLQINLTGFPTLAPGLYSGTLNLTGRDPVGRRVYPGPEVTSRPDR